MGQRISSAKSSASKLWCFINPRFASSESFTPFYGNYEKLKSQEDSFNLQIHPYELQFPFELKKEISCSLQLSNKSDNYLAFKVNTPNPNKYYVTPNIGAVLPRSTCDIIVTMRAQKEAPLDMQCKDEFVIQSIDANHKRYHSKNGATTKDITPEMFNKESCYEVKECKLRVVYIAPPQLPSQVREGSDKDLKASNNKVEQQDTSLQIHPQELQFPFELRKQISCSLQLSNKSDNDVAFKRFFSNLVDSKLLFRWTPKPYFDKFVFAACLYPLGLAFCFSFTLPYCVIKTTNPKKYCVRPNNGVVLPRSTFDIIVIMQAQKQAPPDMQCKDKFLIQSIVANHKSYHSKNGATTKDITPEMFKKESGYEVEECKFKAVYVPPPQPPSLVREGSDEDLSPRASGFPDKARALISKLTEERNSAIDKYKRLEQELELLRREANNNCHT